MLVRKFRTFILFLVLATYSSTQVLLGALAEANIWKERQRSLATVFPKTPLQKIPLTVDKINTGRAFGSAHVFLVQDVHLNVEAQTYTAAVLKQLFEQKKIGAIGVEGAFGPFNFAPFRMFSADIRNSLAQQFLDRKLMAAPSYVGLTNAEAPVIIGIDDKMHYDQNVEALLQAREQKESAMREWERANIQLQNEKRKIFSAQLKRFDDLHEAYHQGTLGIGAYVQSLSAFSVPPDANLDKFRTAVRLETEMDFAQVEQERKQLFERLAPSLPQNELAELTQRSLALRAGQLGFGDYYGGVKRLCERRGVSLQATPHFETYIRYVLLSESLNANEVFGSLNAWETAIAAATAKTSDEKQLLQESVKWSLVAKLIDLSLTADEWEKYTSITKTQNPRTNGLNLTSFEQFYLQADHRSEKMVANLLNHQDPRTKSPLVLVVGGFHTARIAQRLREKNISFEVIAPKITKLEEKGNAYLTAFSREKTPLDKLFAGEKLFISPTNVHLTDHNLGVPFLAAEAAAAGHTSHPRIVWNGTQLSARVPSDPTSLDGYRFAHFARSKKPLEGPSPHPLLNNLDFLAVRIFLMGADMPGVIENLSADTEDAIADVCSEFGIDPTTAKTVLEILDSHDKFGQSFLNLIHLIKKNIQGLKRLRKNPPMLREAFLLSVLDPFFALIEIFNRIGQEQKNFGAVRIDHFLDSQIELTFNHVFGLPKNSHILSDVFKSLRAGNARKIVSLRLNAILRPFGFVIALHPLVNRIYRRLKSRPVHVEGFRNITLVEQGGLFANDRDGFALSGDPDVYIVQEHTDANAEAGIRNTRKNRPDFGLDKRRQSTLASLEIDPDEFHRLLALLNVRTHGAAEMLFRRFPERLGHSRRQIVGTLAMHELKHRYDHLHGFDQPEIHTETSAYLSSIVFSVSPSEAFETWLWFLINEYADTKNEWYAHELKIAWRFARPLALLQRPWNDGLLRTWARQRYNTLQRSSIPQLPDLAGFEPVVIEARRTLDRLLMSSPKTTGGVLGTLKGDIAPSFVYDVVKAPIIEWGISILLTAIFLHGTFLVFNGGPVSNALFYRTTWMVFGFLHLAEFVYHGRDSRITPFGNVVAANVIAALNLLWPVFFGLTLGTQVLTWVTHVLVNLMFYLENNFRWNRQFYLSFPEPKSTPQSTIWSMERAKLLDASPRLRAAYATAKLICETHLLPDPSDPHHDEIKRLLFEDGGVLDAWLFSRTILELTSMNGLPLKSEYNLKPEALLVKLKTIGISSPYPFVDFIHRSLLSTHVNRGAYFSADFIRSALNERYRTPDEWPIVSAKRTPSEEDFLAATAQRTAWLPALHKKVFARLTDHLPAPESRPFKWDEFVTSVENLWRAGLNQNHDGYEEYESATVEAAHDILQGAEATAQIETLLYLEMALPETRFNQLLVDMFRPTAEPIRVNGTIMDEDQFKNYVLEQKNILFDYLSKTQITITEMKQRMKIAPIGYKAIVSSLSEQDRKDLLAMKIDFNLAVLTHNGQTLYMMVKDGLSEGVHRSTDVDYVMTPPIFMRSLQTYWGPLARWESIGPLGGILYSLKKKLRKNYGDKAMIPSVGYDVGIAPFIENTFVFAATSAFHYLLGFHFQTAYLLAWGVFVMAHFIEWITMKGERAPPFSNVTVAFFIGLLSGGLSFLTSSFVFLFFSAFLIHAALNFLQSTRQFFHALKNNTPYPEFFTPINRFLNRLGFAIAIYPGFVRFYRIIGSAKLDHPGFGNISLVRKVSKASPIIRGFSLLGHPHVYIDQKRVAAYVISQHMNLLNPYVTYPITEERAQIYATLSIDPYQAEVSITAAVRRMFESKNLFSLERELVLADAVHELKHRYDDLNGSHSIEPSAYLGSIAVLDSPAEALLLWHEYLIDEIQKPEMEEDEWLRNEISESWTQIHLWSERKINDEDVRLWARERYDAMREELLQIGKPLIALDGFEEIARKAVPVVDRLMTSLRPSLGGIFQPLKELVQKWFPDISSRAYDFFWGPVAEACVAWLVGMGAAYLMSLVPSDISFDFVQQSYILGLFILVIAHAAYAFTEEWEVKPAFINLGLSIVIAGLSLLPPWFGVGSIPGLLAATISIHAVINILAANMPPWIHRQFRIWRVRSRRPKPSPKYDWAEEREKLFVKSPELKVAYDQVKAAFEKDIFSHLGKNPTTREIQKVFAGNGGTLDAWLFSNNILRIHDEWEWEKNDYLSYSAEALLDQLSNIHATRPQPHAYWIYLYLKRQHDRHGAVDCSLKYVEAIINKLVPSPIHLPAIETRGYPDVSFVSAGSLGELVNLVSTRLVEKTRSALFIPLIADEEEMESGPSLKLKNVTRKLWQCELTPVHFEVRIIEQEFRDNITAAMAERSITQQIQLLIYLQLSMPAPWFHRLVLNNIGDLARPLIQSHGDILFDLYFLRRVSSEDLKPLLEIAPIGFSFVVEPLTESQLNSLLDLDFQISFDVMKNGNKTLLLITKGERGPQWATPVTPFMTTSAQFYGLTHYPEGVWTDSLPEASANIPFFRVGRRQGRLLLSVHPDGQIESSRFHDKAARTELRRIGVLRAEPTSLKPIVPPLTALLPTIGAASLGMAHFGQPQLMEGNRLVVFKENLPTKLELIAGLLKLGLSNAIAILVDSEEMERSLNTTLAQMKIFGLSTRRITVRRYNAGEWIHQNQLDPAALEKTFGSQSLFVLPAGVTLTSPRSTLVFDDLIPIILRRLEDLGRITRSLLSAA